MNAPTSYFRPAPDLRPAPAIPAPPPALPGRYRPIAMLGGLVQGMLIGVALLDVTTVIVTRDAVEELDPRALDASLIGLVLAIIAAGIATLCWCYRATANAIALGARDLGVTPAASVWWWFVPFANLVKVPQILTTLSKASRPDHEPGTNAWRSAPGSSLVPLWWAAWIASRVLGRIVVQVDDIDSFWLSTGGLALLAAVDLAAVILAVLVVRGITGDQRARATRLARTGRISVELKDHALT